MLQSRRYDGYETSPDVFYAIQMASVEDCMSSACVYGVVAVPNWQIALFDEPAQEEVCGAIMRYRPRHVELQNSNKPYLVIVS